MPDHQAAASESKQPDCVRNVRIGRLALRMPPT
jgi:hypothetical protein